MDLSGHSFLHYSLIYRFFFLHLLLFLLISRQLLPLLSQTALLLFSLIHDLLLLPGSLLSLLFLSILDPFDLLVRNLIASWVDTLELLSHRSVANGVFHVLFLHIYLTLLQLSLGEVARKLDLSILVLREVSLLL